MKEAGVAFASYPSLRNYVKRPKKEPSLAFLRGAAEFFGVRHEWLILGTGPKYTSTREAIVERAGLTDGPLPTTVQDRLVIHGVEVALAAAGDIPKRQEDPEGHEAFVDDAARVAAFLAAYIQLPIASGIFHYPDLTEDGWVQHATGALKSVKEFRLQRGICQRNDSLIDDVTALVKAGG
jgi:hypothetical protein